MLLICCVLIQPAYLVAAIVLHMRVPNSLLCMVVKRGAEAKTAKKNDRGLVDTRVQGERVIEIGLYKRACRRSVTRHHYRARCLWCTKGIFARGAQQDCVWMALPTEPDCMHGTMHGVVLSQRPSMWPRNMHGSMGM